MAIIWTTDYLVGHGDIDADHRGLVELLGQLEASDAPDVVRAVLHRLSDYVVSHFQREEALMAATGCPFLAEHMAQHDAFAADIAEVIADQEQAEEIDPSLGPALAAALARWLRHHIMVEDKRCAKYLLQSHRNKAEINT